MKAIVVMDQAAGTAGMKLVERPEPQAAINESENWSLKSALSGPKIMCGEAMGVRPASYLRNAASATVGSFITPAR
jgi:hypothetical protein